ncbi:MAG: mannose-1-phosphate guanylyltransferase [Cytophagales bacterium]|nr:mannose-1-phosphate guanylyltransferase [Cytophagales bacterium]
MAGGTGTRLWPHSRQSKPKQFLDILRTGKTLIQMTSERFTTLVDHKDQMIVSNVQYAKLLKEQFPKFSKNQMLLEPRKKNTAPCIAYAAYRIKKMDPEGIMIVSPADHAIFQEEKFLDDIRLAVETASEEKLVTVGIKPNRPETGYGYIQYIESDEAIKRVKTFTEKPELDLAMKFLDSGDFVWNAGIFIWSVKSIIEAFEKYEPELAEIFEEGERYLNTRKEKKFIESAYSQCRSVSVDYAIMEKAENVQMVLGDFDWSDLGSWGSVHDLLEKDEGGNLISGDVLLYNSTNNFVQIPEGKLAILEDMDNYLVADFNDVLVICRKDDSGKFREFVKDVKKLDRDSLL